MKVEVCRGEACVIAAGCKPPVCACLLADRSNARQAGDPEVFAFHLRHLRHLRILLRVDNLIGGYDFNALLSPFGYHAVAAFGVDGLCGVQDELDGRCVAF